MISPIYTINTAGTFNHFPNACADRYIHKYMWLITAIDLTDNSKVLRKAWLSLFNCFRNSCKSFYITDNCIRC